MSDGQQKQKPKTAQQLLAEHYAEQDRLQAEATARQVEAAKQDEQPIDPKNPPHLGWKGMFKNPKPVDEDGEPPKAA